MADPYYGEIRAFAFTYAPVDWAFCDGASIPVSQNQVLTAIIGRTYGGDGVTTIMLPNLKGRAPIHWGPSATSGMNIALAQQSGTETVTLTYGQMPSHGHQAKVGNAPFAQMQEAPSATALPGTPQIPIPNTSPQKYALFQAWQNNNNPDSNMGGGLGPAYSVSVAPHENRTPYLVLNFCICLSGNWPPKPS